MIENWCIGCGLCSENCPYGNINMIEQSDSKKAEVVRKATTCDLCQSLGPNHEPSCVYACPHDAAHRMKGSQLFDLVRELIRIAQRRRECEAQQSPLAPLAGRGPGCSRSGDRRRTAL